MDLDLVLKVQDWIWIVKYDSPLISVEGFKWFWYLLFKLSGEENPDSRNILLQRALG